MGAPLDPAILAERIRGRLEGRAITTKRMFGGLTFLLDGNMLCCVSPKGMMARVGAAQEAEALRRPHAAPCLGTGRPMPGFIMVASEALETDAELGGWIDLALAYVEGLPAKSAGTPRRPAGRAKRNGGN